MTLGSFLLTYLFGGLTFIPLTVVLVIYFVSQPTVVHGDTGGSSDRDSKDAGITNTQETDNGFEEKSQERHSGPDIAAAYFAVCREYVPGGINGKPPERSTPAGEVLISESPSVYQSMYRSIFERGKTSVPSIDADKKDGKAVKKARNVFFVVLRHEHLMLYDDADQLEVRHVISLLHHFIDVYAGGEKVNEGDMWIKRNCIRLIRKPLPGDTTPVSKPFYIFSDNCSEKEDFYHAMLLSQSAALDVDVPPLPQKFEMPHIIKLVQQLHLSEADTHSRWINALLGRIFLAIYKTDELKTLIQNKINRKISRVSKPNFIASIKVQHIHMGDSAPIISNPKLKELTVDGDVTIEADIKYNGAFRIEIAAVARIELGSRFKAREVDLVLAGILRRLNGRLLVRIKPPPSNRLWFTFESMPHLDLQIEPVVSSRQITYSVILRAIESRIREVLGETLVLPNWDDVPFMDTTGKTYRGGIWEKTKREPFTEVPSTPTPEVQEGDEADDTVSDTDDTNGMLPKPLGMKHKTLSMPAILDPLPTDFLHRKSARKSVVSLNDQGVTTSASLSHTPPGSSTPISESPSQSRPHTPAHAPAGKPKAMRSNSFASASTPLATVNDTTASGASTKPKANRGKGPREAVDYIKEVKLRSDSSAHAASAVLDEETAQDEMMSSPPANTFNNGSREEYGEWSQNADENDRTTDPSAAFPMPELSSGVDTRETSSREPAPLSSTFGSTAATAKKWGWNVLNRQAGSSQTSQMGSLGTKSMSGHSSSRSQDGVTLDKHAADAARLAAAKQPIGRGQPLPPPGTPLPGPPKSLWAASTLNNIGGTLRRKPVGTPSLPPRKSNWLGGEGKQSKEDLKEHSPEPPPLPARDGRGSVASSIDLTGRYSRKLSRDQLTGDDDSEDMMVVAAPTDDEAHPDSAVTSSPDAGPTPNQSTGAVVAEDRSILDKGDEEEAHTRPAAGRSKTSDESVATKSKPPPELAEASEAAVSHAAEALPSSTSLDRSDHDYSITTSEGTDLTLLERVSG